MTIEEAKDVLELIMNGHSPTVDAIHECFDVCYKALEKQQKYYWHDLRKDPDDLPIRDGLYAIAIDWDVITTGFGQWETVYGIGCGWSCLMPGAQSVIAWKEIEPFEEEA